MFNNLKLVAGLLTFAGSFAAATPAAEPQSGVQQTTVSYADLNLERPEGAARLYQRIKSAAERVCGPEEKDHLAGRTLHKSCVDQAVERAVVAVAAPTLTRHYEAKTGKTVSSLTLARKD